MLGGGAASAHLIAIIMSVRVRKIVRDENRNLPEISMSIEETKIRNNLR
jgi:hypothetical protein